MSRFCTSVSRQSQPVGHSSLEVLSHLCPHLSAQLEMCLSLADTGLLGYSLGTSVLFSVCKMLHPCQPFVHMGPPALPCCTDGRAQCSSGSFTSSHSKLLWPVVPVDFLSRVQACFAYKAG